MNRARLALGATVVGSLLVAAGALLAAQEVKAPPMKLILAGKTFTPPIKGEALVEFLQPATKREGEKVVRLYTDTIVPAAESNVKAAQSAYVSGKIPFLSLIEAQRNLVELRDRQFELQAEARRRRAALDRATGALPTSGPAHEVLPPVQLSPAR